MAGGRGITKRKKERKRKKKGRQSESKAWGKIKRETCNFDLFYDLWTGPAGEINTDEAELKGIFNPPYLVSRCEPCIPSGLVRLEQTGPFQRFERPLDLDSTSTLSPRVCLILKIQSLSISLSVRPIISPIHLRRSSFFPSPDQRLLLPLARFSSAHPCLRSS